MTARRRLALNQARARREAERASQEVESAVKAVCRRVP